MQLFLDSSSVDVLSFFIVPDSPFFALFNLFIFEHVCDIFLIVNNIFSFFFVSLQTQRLEKMIR